MTKTVLPAFECQLLSR